MAEENETPPPNDDSAPVAPEQQRSPWKGWTLVTTLAVPLLALAIGAGMFAALNDGAGGGTDGASKDSPGFFPPLPAPAPPGADGGGSMGGPQSPNGETANEICREGVGRVRTEPLPESTGTEALVPARILTEVADRLAASSHPNLDLAGAFREQAVASAAGGERLQQTALRAEDLAQDEGLEQCVTLARLLS